MLYIVIPVVIVVVFGIIGFFVVKYIIKKRRRTIDEIDGELTGFFNEKEN